MKRFCTAEDIEDLAAQGKTELIIDENIVLTDLARHMADQLGISIVNRSQLAAAVPAPRPAAPISPVPVSGSAPRPPIGYGSKPKGCQHGPVPTPQPAEVTPVANNSSPASAYHPNTVVDQLVGLVKRLGGK